MAVGMGMSVASDVTDHLGKVSGTTWKSVGSSQTGLDPIMSLEEGGKNIGISSGLGLNHSLAIEDNNDVEDASLVPDVALRR